jgi:hypothetical protein
VVAFPHMLQQHQSKMLLNSSRKVHAKWLSDCCATFTVLLTSLHPHSSSRSCNQHAQSSRLLNNLQLCWGFTQQRKYRLSHRCSSNSLHCSTWDLLQRHFSGLRPTASATACCAATAAATVDVTTTANAAPAAPHSLGDHEFCCFNCYPSKLQVLCY